MNDELLDDTQDMLDGYVVQRSALKKKLWKYVVKGGDIHKLFIEDDYDMKDYMVWLKASFESGAIWDREDDK